MQASVGGSSQQASFLQCYICLELVRKPRMCPSCSKLACLNCLRTWVEESKPQCPHCRKPLLLNNFADCERFVNDIKHLLSNMDNSEKTKEKCSEHKIQLSYYCLDCKQPICSDCGMFGKHRGHGIIHLVKIYQENKTKILNQLAKFDHKIQLFRRNGSSIKQEQQKLQLQVTQRKNFIEQHFVTLMEKLDEEYKEKKERIESRMKSNQGEIEFLQTFRDNITQDLESKSEREVIVKCEEYINCVKSICDRETVLEDEDYSFDTIHELVPKYSKFIYRLENYPDLPDTIVYSVPFELNGLEWRLKIYPKGNGNAKNTHHLSVFLELSKGYQSNNVYFYKIQLINLVSLKDSIIREYSSKFDIGECWGYNQFAIISELETGFLDQNNSLLFHVSVRNPDYRSLVRDQQRYIKQLQNKVNSAERRPSLEDVLSPQIKNEKMNELIQELQEQKQQMRKLFSNSAVKSNEQQEKWERQNFQEIRILENFQNDSNHEE